jgi:hypothetical protein
MAYISPKSSHAKTPNLHNRKKTTIRPPAIHNNPLKVTARKSVEPKNMKRERHSTVVGEQR